MGGIRNKAQVGKVTIKDGTKEEYERFERLYIKMILDRMTREEEAKNQ